MELLTKMGGVALKKRFYFGILLMIVLSILVISKEMNFQKYFVKSNIHDNQKNMWDDLSFIQKNILNTEYSHEKRVEFTLQYINKLLVVLENQASFKLSDNSLEEKLNFSVNSISKEIANAKIRIIVYNGVPGVFGTSEGKWTIIQWRDKGEIHSQILSFNNAEIVVDFIVKENDTLDIMLGGYLDLYSPLPIFLSSFTLNNTKWEKNVYFSKIESNQSYEVDNNYLIVENYKNNRLEINKKNNGFIILNTDDNTLIFDITLDNGKITIKNYSNRTVLGNCGAEDALKYRGA